jgi:osmotically-inducible protein OsmY
MKAQRPPLNAGLLVSLLLLSLVLACSSTRTVGEQASDVTITSKIVAKLTADPEISPFNIDVDTMNGVVTLSGRVRKEVTKTQAERFARNTSGVVKVVNRLEVVSDSG